MAVDFHTTDWKMVVEAAGKDSAASQEALARLCEEYWYPIYAFIRRHGYSAADAEDLTQEYFARFLEKEYLKDVQQGSGRFRAFLLASVKNFLANHGDHAGALKRGGGKILVSLDSSGAEARYRHEPADGVTPEMIYERRWPDAAIQLAM